MLNLKVEFPDDDPRLGAKGVLEDVAWTELMARSQNGDAAAYLRLLQEITPYLRRRVAAYHQDARDIEDTVQDVLLTVHSVRNTYDPSRPFGPWLLAIAKRRVFDSLRRKIQRQGHEVELSDEHDAVPDADDPLDAIPARVRLRGAIEGLPPGQRQAIRLLKIEEKSLKEASEETGMSIASLKVATHRAIKSLRRMLSDRGDL
ncbi:sigma-70 family RNA polymerase sigma factor [Variovorax sp. dw_308]|uniref:sigma-70 family RNA polymerase sigma factor n=1 Tax=Variovorax sp. dw_308 TaxID=2721546 RepID=UPI00210B7B78|nr:sigma-70 family RNA polymerase sigma factor [Variovorax sp. dw_308]